MTTTRKDKYSAAWSPSEATVTLIRDIPAGICGPAGDWPAASRTEAGDVLFAAGYLVSGTWEETAAGDHCVTLSPMR